MYVVTHVYMVTDKRWAKTTVLGDRPRGRLAGRWFDDIVVWSGCTVLEALQRHSGQGQGKITGLNGCVLCTSSNEKIFVVKFT